MSDLKRKKISGEVLARILTSLQHINTKPLQEDQVVTELTNEFDKVENIFCDIEPDKNVSNETYKYKRLACFDDNSFAKLDVMLPWSSYYFVDGKHSIGTPWSSRKRAGAQPFPDPTVENLNRILPLKGLSILEVGCYEGHHTVSLALHSSDVWAIDGRIENVIKTLVRSWLNNCERNVNVNLLDLETNDLAEAFSKFGRSAPFDLIHHRGVLYHLSHPIYHLKQCASICNKYLYLHTQIVAEESANKDIVIDGSCYRVFEYKEPKVDVSPYSGITKYAYWLTQDSLLKALSDVGFSHIDVINLKNERNGPRIELLASK